MQVPIDGSFSSRPTDLLVEWKRHPHVGVNTPRPHLGWVIPHIHCDNFQENLNQLQDKYQVQVSNDPVFDGNKLFSDSSEVESRLSARIPWHGPDLKPHSIYYWRVRVWTSAGCKSEWSDAGKIVTNLFHVGFANTTKPIWSDSNARYVFLRKVVPIHIECVSASLFITAMQEDDKEKLLGAYRLYINQVPVGTGPGRGNTVYKALNHTQYDSYDVTDLITNKDIIIAIQGYHHKGDDTAKIIMELHMQAKDGSSQIFGTDSTWSAFNANDVFNPTGNTGGDYGSQPREFIDARNSPGNWRTIEFKPSSNWKNASEHSVFPTTLKAKDTLPINITTAVPIHIVQTGPKHWFFDFGTDVMAGIQLLWHQGQDGQKLDLRMSEELTSPTTILYPMRTGNTYQMEWTLANGSSSFEQHEYFLFRYGELKVIGGLETCIIVPEEGQCKFECPAGHIISSVEFSSYGVPNGICKNDGGNNFTVNSSCHSQSSTEVVQKLCIGKNSCSFEASNNVFGGDPCHLTVKKFAGAVNCKKSTVKTLFYPRKVNVTELPFSLSAWVVRYPWVNDDSYFESSNHMLNSVWDLCENTLKVTSLDTCTDSNTRERLPYEADGYITGSARYILQREFMWQRHSSRHNLLNPTWPTEWRQTIPLLAYADYLNTGDAELMEVYYDIMKVSTQRDCINSSTKLLDYRKCSHQPGVRDIVDWPKGSRDGYQMTDVSTVNNAYLVGSLTALAEMANATGRTSDAELFFKQADATKLAMNNMLLDKTTGIFVDGLGKLHSAFHAQIFPIFFNVAQSEKMLEFLKTKRMKGSVYSAYAFLLALYNMDFDHGVFALDILTSCEDNSWCNMIKHGASATMEAWTIKEKPNLSWSHPWATAPTTAIANGLMGITPIVPGFKIFQVKPQPGNLTWATIKRPTLAGYIQMNFNQTKDSFKLSISPPAGTLARICLPSKGITGPQLYVDGKSVKGVIEGDYVCVDDIGSSSHPRVIIRGSLLYVGDLLQRA